MIPAQNWRHLTKFWSIGGQDAVIVNIQDNATESFVRLTFDGLVEEGLITEADRENIQASVQQAISRATQIDWGTVSESDTAFVRG